MSDSSAELPFPEILLRDRHPIRCGGEPGNGPGPVQCTTATQLYCNRKANSAGGEMP